MGQALQTPTALATGKSTLKLTTIVYWTATVLFCLQMSFTAYAQLNLPQVAEAFKHLGFPGYFRLELSWAKILAWRCCSRRYRRGSRNGPTPASPSTSSRRSSCTLRWATGQRLGAGRWALA